MSALKCKKCGLINFATAEVCKRCGLSLGGGSHRASDPGSDSSEGVWQDAGLLVMRVDACLPDRCIKCNSETEVRHKVVTAIAYSHWKLPLFLLGYQTIPRIMAKLVPQVRVEVALCKKHSSNWSRDLRINLPLIVIGLGLLVLSFYLKFAQDLPDTPFTWFAAVLGILSFATGALSSVIGGDPVYLRRRRSGCVWLKGAGESYLASLPRWP
jgi:hypothetical protein